MSSSGWHRKRRTEADAGRAREYNSRQHRELRAARVAASNPRTPCSRCRNPLGPDKSKWHLPHTADRTGYHPGLWCARCNRSEAAQRGARIANARRKIRRATVTTLRW